MKLPNEAPKQDYLCLPYDLLLLVLEYDKVARVEVDGQQCIVDRGGQIALVPPLLTKHLVEGNQQANIENIEAGVSTYCHRSQILCGEPPCSCRSRTRHTRYT